MFIKKAIPVLDQVVVEDISFDDFDIAPVLKINIKNQFHFLISSNLYRIYNIQSS